ncbi:MAG: hypothetical protein KAF42_02065 [Sphingopyxis terrae]|nr:hypothetical protein [Sphingopyxis terrae]
MPLAMAGIEGATMAKSLAERLAAAKTNDRIRVADLEALIADARVERDRLLASAESHDEDSINYALSDDDREEASRLASHYGRTARGLSNEIDMLAARLEDARDTDRQRARDAEREAALSERDALAARIKSEWPALEYAIVELLTAIEANDARLHSAAPGEDGAEAVARCVPGNFFRNGVRLRRLKETKLPSFAEPNHLAWPKPVRMDWGLANNTAARQAMQAERAAENARWSRYMVQAPTDGTQTIIESRAGMIPMRLNVVEAVMTAEGVKDAEASGCIVTPLKPNETVGQPADMVIV